MSVSIGDPAPDFSLDDIDGIPTTLTEHRGRKVMLSFYRSADCPFCNYAIDVLQGNHKKLAWAANLDVIIIFQSTTEAIDNFIFKSRRTTKNRYPFTVLADPDQMAFKKYRVTEQSQGTFRDLLREYKETREYNKYIKKYSLQNEIDKQTYQYLLPTDFLIDENGIIVDCFRSNALTKHIPMRRIKHFLCHGEKKETKLSLISKLKNVC
mmetsp:Transcript_9059/g.13366  ORF Transcript_9059/g.13366 Transcript_9059/m.13366 type:complete len:209 (-) Transcript_9059:22-648(-)